MSYLHEGATDKAIAEIEKQAAIAKAGGDKASLSGDWNQIGDILLEAGRADEALAKYKEQVATMEAADVPAEVKEATRRNTSSTRRASPWPRRTWPPPRPRRQAYAAAVAGQEASRSRCGSSTSWRGGSRLEEKNYAVAAAELEQANQQDPRVAVPAGGRPAGQGRRAEGADGGGAGRGLQRLSAHLRVREGQGEDAPGGQELERGPRLPP